MRTHESWIGRDQGRTVTILRINLNILVSSGETTGDGLHAMQVILTLVRTDLYLQGCLTRKDPRPDAKAERNQQS